MTAGWDEWGLGAEQEQPVPVGRRAPLGWLLPALLAAIGGALVSTLFPPAWWSLILGWAMTGPTGVAFLTLFVNRDLRARSSNLYATSFSREAFYWISVVIVALAVIWTAIQLADWWARQ